MADGPRELAPGHQINRYTVLRPLGRGGMGVVYAARDERLGRDVALKMILGLADETAKSRFWREARLAASVSHPHICQIFEVDESPDGMFLTMELLEGDTLADRLRRGALAPAEATSIAVAVLGALDALHGRGFVHRDVKPLNIFMTGHGPKLLDFGLAKPAAREETVILDAHEHGHITDANMIVGTPVYMAPEQITGGDVDGRTDLYSLGVVLFQMLAGRLPFGGPGLNPLVATLQEHPPALQGGPEIVALDRVIRRAMRKQPRDRYASAREMADELSAVAMPRASSLVVPVRALTRVIVPPLKIARPDPNVAYLSFGLADSVSGALAAISDVVVRAPALAARWNDEGGDPRRLAVEADVDLVVTGTLLQSGSQLRITVQLLDAVNGTVVGSTTVKGSVDDVFAIEDGMATAAMQLVTTHRPGASTTSPTTARRRDVPASPKAFELFLRGLECARTLNGTADARKLLLEAVGEDPEFAPAWAALGRCHRVYGKYFEQRAGHEQLADEAFRRALALSPELPLAHRYVTHFEAEEGRAEAAIARLLRHAQTNRNDAQLFAGLVHACRYAGLIEASVAAHDEARRLDPNVATSVEYTWAHLVVEPGDAATLAAKLQDTPELQFVLGSLGGLEAMRAAMPDFDVTKVPPGFRISVDAIEAAAMRPVGEAKVLIEKAIASHTDPEAIFLFGTVLVQLREFARGLEVIGGAVRSGYTPADTLKRNWIYEAVRTDATFVAIEAEARRRMLAARDVFERENGPALLAMAAAVN